MFRRNCFILSIFAVLGLLALGTLVEPTLPNSAPDALGNSAHVDRMTASETGLSGLGDQGFNSITLVEESGR